MKLRNYTPLRYRKRRYYLLLEVMIAFTLVILCIVPLLRSHLFVVTQERRLHRQLGIERAVHQIFAEIIMQMYANAISWETIEGGVRSLINSNVFGNRSPDFERAVDFLAEEGCRAEFFFETERNKENDEGTESYHWLALKLAVNRAKERERIYERALVVRRSIS